MIIKFSNRLKEHGKKLLAAMSPKSGEKLDEVAILGRAEIESKLSYVIGYFGITKPASDDLLTLLKDQDYTDIYEKIDGVLTQYEFGEKEKVLKHVEEFLQEFGSYHALGETQGTELLDGARKYKQKLEEENKKTHITEQDFALLAGLSFANKKELEDASKSNQEDAKLVAREEFRMEVADRIARMKISEEMSNKLLTMLQSPNFLSVSIEVGEKESVNNLVDHMIATIYNSSESEQQKKGFFDAIKSVVKTRSSFLSLGSKVLRKVQSFIGRFRRRPKSEPESTPIPPMPREVEPPKPREVEVTVEGKIPEELKGKTVEITIENPPPGTIIEISISIARGQLDAVVEDLGKLVPVSVKAISAELGESGRRKLVEPKEVDFVHLPTNIEAIAKRVANVVAVVKDVPNLDNAKARVDRALEALKAVAKKASEGQIKAGVKEPEAENLAELIKAAQSVTDSITMLSEGLRGKADLLSPVSAEEIKRVAAVEHKAELVELERKEVTKEHVVHVPKEGEAETLLPPAVAAELKEAPEIKRMPEQQPPASAKVSEVGKIEPDMEDELAKWERLAHEEAIKFDEDQRIKAEVRAEAERKTKEETEARRKAETEKVAAREKELEAKAREDAARKEVEERKSKEEAEERSKKEEAKVKAREEEKTKEEAPNVEPPAPPPPPPVAPPPPPPAAVKGKQGVAQPEDEARLAKQREKVAQAEAKERKEGGRVSPEIGVGQKKEVEHRAFSEEEERMIDERRKEEAAAKKEGGGLLAEIEKFAFKKPKSGRISYSIEKVIDDFEGKFVVSEMEAKQGTLKSIQTRMDRRLAENVRDPNLLLYMQLQLFILSRDSAKSVEETIQHVTKRPHPADVTAALKVDLHNEICEKMQAVYNDPEQMLETLIDLQDKLTREDNDDEYLVSDEDVEKYHFNQTIEDTVKRLIKDPKVDRQSLFDDVIEPLKKRGMLSGVTKELEHPSAQV